MRLTIPFQDLLQLVKALSPTQKERLKQELDFEMPSQPAQDEFINLLLEGPVYSPEDIQKIEENRKSIAQWR